MLVLSVPRLKGLDHLPRLPPVKPWFGRHPYSGRGGTDHRRHPCTAPSKAPMSGFPEERGEEGGIRPGVVSLYTRIPTGPECRDYRLGQDDVPGLGTRDGVSGGSLCRGGPRGGNLSGPSTPVSRSGSDPTLRSVSLHQESGSFNPRGSVRGHSDVPDPSLSGPSPSPTTVRPPFGNPPDCRVPPYQVSYDQRIVRTPVTWRLRHSE